MDFFEVITQCTSSRIRSDRISGSVVSDSLRPHESQHARPPCPSPTPGVHSDSRPSSRWCHPAISSSVVPFSSCPQYLPASESFPMSQLFACGGQSTGVSRIGKFFLFPWWFWGQIDTQLNCFNDGQCCHGLHFSFHFMDNTKPSEYWSYAAAAAAAKSLQLCPTLCDPIDGSPPGSPVPGILQARTLEWVATSFSNAWKWKVKEKSLSRVWLLVTPWTAAHQAPPSMGFSRQEYWSGVPLPSPIGHIFRAYFMVCIWHQVLFLT